MKHRAMLKFASICMMLLFVLPLHVLADTPEYQSASVLVMDLETGRILYENEGYALRYPASIVKVMTALLVLEHVDDFHELVIFSENAVDIPYYASRMWINVDESITVLEAMYGIMLPSGNEVARALAEHVSGTVEDFVALMNHRAAELGATNTNFVNPCGLPGDGQFTTAYDIALIMREAIQHPLFIEIIATAYFDMPPTEEHPDGRELTNSNRMVRPDTEEFNEHVIGGKTGFTNAAQHTLVTHARRDNHAIIVVTLYAARLETFHDTAVLMEYAFALLDAEAVAEEIYEYEYDDLPDTYPAFAQSDTSYDAAPPEVEDYQHYYISNTEAIAVAAMALGVAIVALVLVRLADKKPR